MAELWDENGDIRMRWFIVAAALVSFLSFFIFSAYALENSTVSCIDNTTLLENITVYKDGNLSWYALPLKCVHGCDSITMSCNPPPYVQDLTIFALITIFIAAMYIVLRRRK